MISPLEKPYFPGGKVRHAAVSGKDKELIIKLEQLNIQPIITVPSKNLDNPVSDHTDMLLYINNKTITADKSQYDNFVKFLTIGYKCNIYNETIRSPYPFDCRLNTLALGKSFFYNEKTTDNKIIDNYLNNSVKPIKVNQGYIKCAICPVTDNAFITDDTSIYNAAVDNGFDALLVSKGSVKLKGYDYGFIGGCTGFIDKNVLLFNGDINYHKDCNKIIDFLSLYNVKAEIIENKPLYDVGSIVPLTSEV